MIWFTLALIFIVIEIYHSSFIFLSLGIGAILTGLLSLRFSTTLSIVIFFVIISFLLYLWLKKISRRLFIYSSSKTNVNNLLNKRGILTKEITSTKNGYVKIGRDEWPAHSTIEEQIISGKVVKVVGFENNKLIVSTKFEDE